jgi:hypothetical protein
LRKITIYLLKNSGFHNKTFVRQDATTWKMQGEIRRLVQFATTCSSLLPDEGPMILSETNFPTKGFRTRNVEVLLVFSGSCIC